MDDSSTDQPMESDSESESLSIGWSLTRSSHNESSHKTSHEHNMDNEPIPYDANYRTSNYDNQRDIEWFDEILQKEQEISKDIQELNDDWRQFIQPVLERVETSKEIKENSTGQQRTESESARERTAKFNAAQSIAQARNHQTYRKT